ncbi:glycerol kinase GlpK [Dermatophilaceae bacterium Soc4.6]
MTETYVAAIDQGTTSTRCMLFDRSGTMVSVSQRQHHQRHPHPGWVEHDAAEIWSIVQEVVPRALADAAVRPEQVVSIGVTNQRETTVVWDPATGRPVMPAIVWQDTRTGAVLEDIATRIAPDDVLARTGLPLSSYSSGPKLRWALQSVPGLRERAEAGNLLFGTMDTWLVWNLTGGVRGGLHITDVTNASRTMLMDLRTLDWDDGLLTALEIPRSMLPRIVPTVGVVGRTTDPVPGIAIGAVVGDQQASLFGHTAFDVGEAKCTFGTGAFLLLNTGRDVVASQHGLITTVAYQVGDEPVVYALEGSIATAGALVQWVRDHLGLIRTVSEIETLARTVSDTGGCYLVPAFSGLFAPHWNPSAQGLVVGLTSYVTKAHLARAVLESVAWQTRDIVEAMAADLGQPVSSLTVDGGMTTDNLLMQMIADALGVPVVRPKTAETVALGAAYAAGLAVGYWPDRRVLRSTKHRAGQWDPAADPAVIARTYAAWGDAVGLAARWGDLRRDH